MTVCFNIYNKTDQPWPEETAIIADYKNGEQQPFNIVAAAWEVIYVNFDITLPE